MKSLARVLHSIQAEQLFAVIPLGDDQKFFAPSNNLDVTHVTCKPMDWWSGFFKHEDFTIVRMTYRIEGIKDSYEESHPNSFGYFHLRKKC